MSQTGYYKQQPQAFSNRIQSAQTNFQSSRPNQVAATVRPPLYYDRPPNFIRMKKENQERLMFNAKGGNERNFSASPYSYFRSQSITQPTQPVPQSLMTSPYQQKLRLPPQNAPRHNLPPPIPRLNSDQFYQTTSVEFIQGDNPNHITPNKLKKTRT